jgi:hypothetical protein
VIGGALKIAYDLLLLAQFRNAPPPEVAFGESLSTSAAVALEDGPSTGGVLRRCACRRWLVAMYRGAVLACAGRRTRQRER